MVYVVKMDGMKVRSFEGVSIDRVTKWAEKHCCGQRIEVVSLIETEMPHASKMRSPESYGLRCKVFIPVNA